MASAEWFSPIGVSYEKGSSHQELPERVSEVLEIPYLELSEALDKKNPAPFVELVPRLLAGAALLLKQAFNPSEVERLKELALELRKSEQPSFHKALEGVPNFWRDIGEEEMGSYALSHIKKSCYFFPWNGESSEVFSIVYPRWRVLKTLAGLAPNEYEDFTPKDGKVDRLQIAEYPAGTGFLAPHQDPDHNQRLIMSAYLSKRGVDYTGGGFWALSGDGEKLEVEDHIDVGDLGTCVASIIHGVDATSNIASPDTSAPAESDHGKAQEGSRWWVGFYTNDSDELTDRKTGRQVSLN